MNDPLDKQVINSMLDHFITPAACKKDYEIPKSKDGMFFLRLWFRGPLFCRKSYSFRFLTN